MMRMQPTHIDGKLRSGGSFAWVNSQPGQVGNEAATTVPIQCRSQARHFQLLRQQPLIPLYLY